jgi:hypothetical protein
MTSNIFALIPVALDFFKRSRKNVDTAQLKATGTSYTPQRHIPEWFGRDLYGIAVLPSPRFQHLLDLVQHHSGICRCGVYDVPSGVQVCIR